MVKAKGTAASDTIEHAARSVEAGIEGYGVMSGSTPQAVLYTGSSASVLCCQQMLPGDILVATHYIGTLVVRPTTAVSAYEIVCRASLMPPYTIPRSRWNCYCWSASSQKPPDPVDIRVGLELTDAQALLMGISNSEACKGQTLIEYAVADMLGAGTIITDVTACKPSDWQEPQMLRPMPKACRIYGTNAFQLSLVAHCGGSVEAKA